MTRAGGEPKTDAKDVVRRFQIALIAACSVSCGNAASPPSCEAVGAKFVVIANRDLEAAKLDDDTRRRVLDQIPAMRDSLVNACNDSTWQPSVRACMLDAIDHAAFERCETALTPEQRNALERSGSNER